MRARVHIAQGRLQDATAWARAHHLGPDDPASYLAEYEQLTLARLLLAQHRADPQSNALDDAFPLLDRVVAAAEAAIVVAQLPMAHST